MGDCDLFNFVLWGVISSVSCILGMMGNVLAFIAFQKDRRSPATTLIQSLACSDFLLLAAIFVTDAVPYACGFTRDCPNLWYTWPYIRYIWILTPTAHLCSIWFVVLIACNRYWAVCIPHKMQTIWSIPRTLMYVVGAVLLVILFNLPRVFEYTMKYVPKRGNDDNTVFCNENVTMAVANGNNYTSYLHYDGNTTMPPCDQNATENLHDNNKTIELVFREVRTGFGLHHIYRVVYKSYLVNIVLIMLPLLTLIILTVRILCVIHMRKQKSKDMKNSTMARASSEITFLLVLVVVVAIICQTPLAMFHFVRYTQDYHCGDFIFYLDNISKLLVTINSSINFTIYCLFSAKFRRLLFATLTCNSSAAQIEPFSSTRTKTKNNKDYTLASMRG